MYQYNQIIMITTQKLHSCISFLLFSCLMHSIFYSLVILSPLFDLVANASDFRFNSGYLLYYSSNYHECRLYLVDCFTFAVQQQLISITHIERLDQPTSSLLELLHVQLGLELFHLTQERGQDLQHVTREAAYFD